MAQEGWRGAASSACVTRGLDPRVHLLSQEALAKTMDCRVEPGNDRRKAR
jgi:hypothetical protein